MNKGNNKYIHTRGSGKTELPAFLDTTQTAQKITCPTIFILLRVSVAAVMFSGNRCQTTTGGYTD